MAGVNKVILIGNLGRDPEMKYTQSGTPVCKLSLATTRSWTNKSGEKTEETEWHRVTVWNKIKSGELPAPTMFGPKSPRLLESTLDNYIANLPRVDYAPAETAEASAHDGPIAA